jgi:hypothetical protein
VKRIGRIISVHGIKQFLLVKAEEFSGMKDSQDSSYSGSVMACHYLYGKKLAFD